MGRSKETFGKKEVRNKQAKKRKDKEKRRLEKKEQGKGTMDDMIAYVDENGMLSSTPPDPTKKKEEIDLEDIEIGVPKTIVTEEDKIRKGKVNHFDDSKGFGFIVDIQSNDSLFVHINDCNEELRIGDQVEFETEKGPKGLKAIKVKRIK